MWGDAAELTPAVVVDKQSLAVVVDKQSLLGDKDRLEEVNRSYDGEVRLVESLIVLTDVVSLIASLGLVADNNAVITGAMVVAPWILPLRVTVFAILIGQARLVSRSLITLVAAGHLREHASALV